MSSVALASSLSVSALKVGLGRDGHFLEELGSPDDIKKMLDSKFPTDKVAGMKSVLALAYLGRDASTFFSDVVKNVAAANMELKKLVYMYLVRYAGEQPDLALLSVNSFQRDLENGNQLIRASALRVMSSIRLPIIQPIVLMAVVKCAKDSSAHVRRAAANALPKLAAAEPPADEPTPPPTPDRAAAAADETAAGGGSRRSSGGGEVRMSSKWRACWCRCSLTRRPPC